MKQILVYGDSVSWGMIPGTRLRQPFEKRWPGVLEGHLLSAGISTRVIEDCLNGRKTVWDDPFRPGRNGAERLSEVIELSSPLALVIIALGTNDFQLPGVIEAWASALGIGRLIDIISRAPIEPGLKRPEILVLAPAKIEQPPGEYAPRFQGADERSAGCSDALQRIAATKSVAFFDINAVTGASLKDGIHLEGDQHAAVGAALDPIVQQILI